MHLIHERLKSDYERLEEIFKKKLETKRGHGPLWHKSKTLKDWQVIKFEPINLSTHSMELNQNLDLQTLDLQIVKTSTYKL
jgi:hypothetical protein